MKASIMLLVLISLSIISTVFMFRSNGVNEEILCKDTSVDDEKLNQWNKERNECYQQFSGRNINYHDECESEMDYSNEKVKDYKLKQAMNQMCSAKYNQCQEGLRNRTWTPEEQQESVKKWRDLDEQRNKCIQEAFDKIFPQTS